MSDSQRTRAPLKPKFPRLFFKRLKDEAQRRLDADWHSSYDEEFNVVIVPHHKGPRHAA